MFIKGVDEAGGVLEVVDVKDCFKDSAMFSNFFSKAASSRSCKALRSMPVASSVGTWSSWWEVDNGVVSVGFEQQIGVDLA